MKNKKLVYVHRTKGAGVEGVHINGIVNAFKKAGADVEVISPAGTADVNDSQKPHLGSGRLLKFFSLYTPEIVFELFEILYNLRCYLGLIGQRSTSLIYERYAFFAFAAAWFSSRRLIPFILEVNYYSATPLVRCRSRILLPLARRVEKFVFENADCIITVSTHLKEKIIEYYGLPEEKFLVQTNAVDLDRFDLSQQVEQEIDDKTEVIIGFVGGFYAWHGLDFLVKVFNELLSHGKDVKLLLIGDGPEKQKIEEQVKRLGIQKYVDFTGAVAPQELPRYMSKFDIGVMPNSNEYGSPMKIFEYMATGVAVVAPDYSPILDVIENKFNGFVFQRNNAESFRLVLEGVIDNPELTTKVVDQAIQDIKLKYNWDAHVVEILDYVKTKDLE